MTLYESDRIFHHLHPDDPRAAEFVRLLKAAKRRSAVQGLCWAISRAGGYTGGTLYATSSEAVALINWMGSSMLWKNSKGDTKKAAYVDDWLRDAHGIDLKRAELRAYRLAWADHMIAYFGGGA